MHRHDANGGSDRLRHHVRSDLPDHCSSSPDKDCYQTKMVKMSHGSRHLSLSSGAGETVGIVFDSGGSYKYFTKQAYSDLVDSLTEIPMEGLTKDTSDTTLPICWQAKSPIKSVMDVKHFFKTLTLQFERKWWNGSPKFQIPLESYLIISKKGNVCLGILDGSEVHDGYAFILRDISLRGQLIVFVNVNQKIGWTPSNCAQPENFQGTLIRMKFDWTHTTGLHTTRSNGLHTT